MREADFLVVPSECYENFPLVLAEAFASGLPVVASRLGSLAEIVEDGITGLQFCPGDAGDLAAQVRRLAEGPAARKAMELRARQSYEEKYTPERNYQELSAIYGLVRKTLTGKAERGAGELPAGLPYRPEIAK